jgi:hypothetical protein
MPRLCFDFHLDVWAGTGRKVVVANSEFRVLLWSKPFHSSLCLDLDQVEQFKTHNIVAHSSLKSCGRFTPPSPDFSLVELRNLTEAIN